MNWPEVYLHMKAGTSLDESHRKQVEAVLEKYPFFALGRMMVAKVAAHTGDPQAQQLRFLASLYAPSRQYYAFFLEEKLRPRIPPPPKAAVASAREGHPPAPSSSSQEETPSSDEPGPADMAFSSVFWPPLQGWLAARQTLYASLHTKLLQQLHLPEPTHPEEASLAPSSGPADFAPPNEELANPSPPAPSALPPETQSEPPPSPSTASVEPPPVIAEHTTETPNPVPSLSDTPDLPPPTLLRPLVVQPTFSGRLPIPIIQFELLPGPLPAGTVNMSLSQGRSEPPTAESETAAPLLETSSPPPIPSEPTSAPIEPAPESPKLPIEPLSALTKAYIPLENPEGFIHPHETEERATAEAETPSTEAENTLHRSFIPLESPDSPIHLPIEGNAVSAPPSWVYVSESPIRPLIPFEIDIEASIHLPVPQITEEATAPKKGPIDPLAPKEETAHPLTEPSPTEKEPHSQPWQSFLREIELQVPLSELKASPISKELDNLRRTFIRQLLEQRPTEPLRPPSPENPNLIDKLIEKLQTFPKAPAVEAPPELSAPAWEPPPQQPRIYTETMAKLYWSQGDLPRAIQVYEALCEKYPDRAAYFRSQIERIRSGEMP